MRPMLPTAASAARLCPRPPGRRTGECRPRATDPLRQRNMLSSGQTGAVGDSATFRLDGHVATITYNRPDALNAINADMRRDLNDAFSRFRDDEEAWVAIVTGSGRAFCVGADLRQGAGSAGVPRHILGETDAEFIRERVGNLQTDHCGGEWLLPGLRAHACHLVRFRPGERPSRVRSSRGETWSPGNRGIDTPAAAHQLGRCDGAVAHGGANRRGASTRDGSRLEGRPP